MSMHILLYIWFLQSSRRFEIVIPECEISLLTLVLLVKPEYHDSCTDIKHLYIHLTAPLRISTNLYQPPSTSVGCPESVSIPTIIICLLSDGFLATNVNVCIANMCFIVRCQLHIFVPHKISKYICRFTHLEFVCDRVSCNSSPVVLNHMLCYEQSQGPDLLLIMHSGNGSDKGLVFKLL